MTFFDAIIRGNKPNYVFLKKLCDITKFNLSRGHPSLLWIFILAVLGHASEEWACHRRARQKSHTTSEDSSSQCGLCMSVCLSVYSMLLYKCSMYIVCMYVYTCWVHTHLWMWVCILTRTRPERVILVCIRSSQVNCFMSFRIWGEGKLQAFLLA